MKKTIISLVVFSLLLISQVQALAQTPQPPQISDNNVLASFESLGYTDEVLFSPYDSTRVLFSTPPNWIFPSEAELVLDIDVFLSGDDAAAFVEGNRGYIGNLEITFNGQIIKNVNISEVGSQSISIQIPTMALIPTRNDGRHELIIFLDAAISCEYDLQSIVSVQSTSYFQMDYEVTPPELNLSKLPYPFYTRDTILPDQTYLIVPDDPSSKELQAAFNVAAGFGSMTGRDFNFQLLPVSQLLEYQLASSNLIFVGKPGAFASQLSIIDLLIPIIDNQFDVEDQNNNDGIIQLVQSPWNSGKAVLVVSGNTVGAVDKAAKAVSTGEIFVNENPRVIFVASTNPEQLEPSALVEDITLKDLGYPNETISGIGTGGVDYQFNISKEQVDSKEAYIDLIYLHSGLLDYTISSMKVLLNDEPIASSLFTEETINLTTLHIDIPPNLLRFGENRLSVEANLIPYNSCDVTGFSEYWLTVFSDSAIHIPPAPQFEVSGLYKFDLKMYPEMFFTQNNLSDIAFVIPKTFSTSWNIASQIAFSLGIAGRPEISNIMAAYDDEMLFDEVVQQRSLLIIGRPSALSIIQDINDQLPAPFDIETDTAIEYGANVIYRIPPGESIGYLEVISSPYSPGKALLIVSGNNDYGVELAGNALLIDSLTSQLAGSFSITNGTQVAVSKDYGAGIIRQATLATVMPEAEAVIAQPLSLSASEHIETGSPIWLIPVILASAIAVLVILAQVILSARIQKKKNK